MITNPPQDGRAVLAQIVRYGITGGLVTLLGVSVYWVAATSLDFSNQAANALAYVVAVGVGYFAHRAYTFRDQAGTRSLNQSLRFVSVSIVSYLLNALWVNLLTFQLSGPDWWPIPAMIFVTPAIVFVLNRKWVFR